MFGIFGDIFKGIGKTTEAGMEAIGSPFSSDRKKRNKFYANILTMGASGGLEVLGENVLKPTMKTATKEIGRGLGNFGEDIQAGMSLAANNDPLGMANNAAKQEATREIYDPRRRNQKASNFGSLTSGQFESQPSLIG